MLDNSGTAQQLIPVFAKRAKWLKERLEEFKDEKKIICCHVPLMPIRDVDILAKSFGFRSFVTVEPEILELVREHSDSILAVLSGHLHLTGTVVDQGVLHIDISGTASYPGDFALYSVYEDRIEVNVQSVPEELQKDASNIHGNYRHGIDYTDSKHPTHEEYMKGLPSERQFSIPL